MLTQLTIHNFAIVKQLDIELDSGMTTITGETGAGKSIAIDALSLCLGGRGEAAMVRPGCSKADISARFNLANNPLARHYLKTHDLELDGECIIRRTISGEGRSRGYINGSAVPLAQLKSLGQLLINIHGQHAHQGLIRPDNQLQLLDNYAGHQDLLDQVKLSYRHWQSLNRELQSLQQQQQHNQARLQLLEYQKEELDQFALQAGEYEEIERQHSRLANGEELQHKCHALLQQLTDDDQYAIEGSLQSAVAAMEHLAAMDSKLAPLAEMLNGALIQLQESGGELRSYGEQLELDPAALAELDERLGQALQLARKHNVLPQQLPEFHQQLNQELGLITGCDERIEEIEQLLVDAENHYNKAAQVLSHSRRQQAETLAKLITHSMRQLGMEHGQLTIDIAPVNGHNITPLGQDLCQFEVTANPGQPLQPLHKVASGGELSRISLAIQVITAKKITTPTLIFDEVDVGISGPTAATVGKLLRELGSSTQVFCVTHLPQVAGCGHQQLQVEKQTDGKSTHTQMRALNRHHRIKELARLLGGNSISDKTLANAEELLLEAS